MIVDRGHRPADGGCTVCHTQATATVCGCHGRRCAAHPHAWDAGHAVDLMVSGFEDAALHYVRTGAP